VQEETTLSLTQCLDLGEVLLLKTDVECHSRLVPWLHAGEGGDGEKVEGLVVHVRNEEKGESIEGKPRHT